MAQKKKAPKEQLLVQSKVKEYVRANDMMVAGDLMNDLNEAVHALLDAAVKRAGANNRKTVRGSDV